ncbi:MAG TPA: iron-containing alcohol dehydrogenase [Bryobacteraceae bacterium]|nr:iron-containing alcohol dehydrogenase [Bryobacteraceae bacterium]
MRFEFASAGRTIFGQGVTAELPALVKPFGKRALVVTGSDRIRHAALIGNLEAGGCACALFGVRGEPTVAIAQKGAGLARSRECQVVIAIGGGSAIDAGKAISALATNPGDVLDYLEVVGRALPLPNTPLPFIAIPTTAGTGSEVTRNAVLGSPEHSVKASLRSNSMLPRIALVDPELTYGLPPRLTASTGLDAVTQLIEPYVSSRANPATDALCLDGLRNAAASLRRAYRDGGDIEARARMSYASLLGGLALANAGLGVVHGLAAPIGGMFDAPHGAVCAAILPHGMRANIVALRERMPESDALRRYETIARLLTSDANATPEAGADWIGQLVTDLDVPPLRAYGVTKFRLPEIAEKATNASSMKANPIPLTAEEISFVIERAL